MSEKSRANIVPFPGHAQRGPRACPQCGTQTAVWRFGRLLWGYCDDHELRWIAADYGRARARFVDRRELTRNLEFLAAFAEVTSG